MAVHELSAVVGFSFVGPVGTSSSAVVVVVAGAV